MISLNVIKGPDICSICKEHTKENLEARRLSGDYLHLVEMKAVQTR